MAAGPSAVPVAGPIDRRRQNAMMHRRTTNVPGHPAIAGFVAFLAILMSAWGGLAPFIGPTFAYSGAGGVAWHWDLARAVLSVVPAGAGIVGALLVLGAAGSWRRRGVRGGVGLGGLLVVLAGGWFALGWIAWKPLEGYSYISSSTAFRQFVNVLGLAVGPGVVLAALGAMMLGFLAYAGGELVETDLSSVKPNAGAGAPVDYQPARNATAVDRPIGAPRESAAGWRRRRAASRSQDNAGSA